MLVTPARPVDQWLSSSLKPSDVSAVPQPKRPSRAAQQAAAERRRGVLVVLVSLTAVTATVAAFSMVPWWSFGIPLTLVFAFLVVARRQVRKIEEAFWVEAAHHRPQPSNVVRRAAARVNASHGATRDTTDPADGEPTVTLSAREIAAEAPDQGQQRVTAMALVTADGGSLWDPLPITLPTYVDKPAARRTIRTIELGEPGTWSAGHDADDSRTAAQTIETEADTTVEERRRAVNE